jgi:hypothetical protein
VLKYYKVDGDGKIERLRRECPQEGVSRLYLSKSEHKLTYHSVVLVSSWPPCTTASTAAGATSLTSSTRPKCFTISGESIDKYIPVIAGGFNDGQRPI